MAQSPCSDKPSSSPLLQPTPLLSTISGFSHPVELEEDMQGLAAKRVRQQTGANQLAAEMPFNPRKASEHGLAHGLWPQQGLDLKVQDEVITASTLTEETYSEKVGEGEMIPGLNSTNTSLDAARVDSTGRMLTTNQGVVVSDNQNSLKAGLRGPTLLEDFILREKITHFDHERIPERIVHARGSAAHGYFECYAPMTDVTRASVFGEAGKRTPVFVRFSTVAGERGSADTVRDTRGFATKFYTDEGNWDLVGNNIPVFFIQDAMKFPDLIHAVKPEPHHGMPQASSAHDTFWDFMSLMPESIHHTLWVMSDRGIPRSYRTMQGFGVHTFRFVNDQNESVFVKFHWAPMAGTHSMVWDEAAKLNGVDPDFHRRDLWESIEAGVYPEYELGVQIFTEQQADDFPIDVLDATKLIPEEWVPITPVGKMVLNRNPDNFFAETEQVAFCAAHVVPGIDFSNDPLLQGRLHSYLDTQLSRLGGPNFHEIPINASLAEVHNNQRDGLHRKAINRGRVAYEPNSLGGGCPFQGGMSGFVSYAQSLQEDKVRGKPEKFADHYSQAQLFWRSQTAVERQHIIAAFRFELSRVTVPAIRQRVVSILLNVNQKLAEGVANGLGIDLPAPQPTVIPLETEPSLQASAGLSLFARPGKYTHKGRRVAVLVTAEADLEQLSQIHQLLRQDAVVSVFVAPRLGTMGQHKGTRIEAETSLEAMPSVVWDAMVMMVPEASLPALCANGQVVEFFKDQYRHCKPIWLLGAGSQWLTAVGVPAIAKNRPDPGLVISESADSEALKRFLNAIRQHRHFDREMNPPVV